MKRSKKKKPKEKRIIKPQNHELSKHELRENRRRQRKKNKQKRLMKALITILIMLGLIGVVSFGIFQAINQGVFNVTEIEVVGNEIVDASMTV